MAAPAFRPSYRWVGDAMRMRTIRRALDAEARRIAARVQQLAAAEGTAVTVDLTPGTRPRGRPYVRVSIPANIEHGDWVTDRRRLLGRAAGR